MPAKIEFFGPSRKRNTGYSNLLRNVQQVSHSFETLRLERSGEGCHDSFEHWGLLFLLTDP